MADRPPTPPWKKGVNQAYTCFSIDTEVCVDKDGQVWSSHSLEREDEEISRTLQNYGEPQIAFALLTEALRREVFNDALLELSKDRKFIETYKTADAETRKQIEKNLANAALNIIVRSSRHMLLNITREILAMMSDRESS